MSGLYSSLNTTVKALNAQSRGIDLSGRNLANVNNPAYARQRVILGDRGTVVTPDGAQSLGLEALGVQQLRDSLLDRQVTREVSLKAAFAAEQQAYQRAQAGLGQGIDAITATGGAATGLGAALNDFFNSFQGLASRPTDSGERQTLLQKAAILTDRLRLTDSRLDQVQTDLDAQIASDVDSINGLLQSIAELNAQIHRTEINRPGGAADLRDQRQARIEELSAKLPVEVRPGAGGQVQLVMKDAANADVLLVDGPNVTGPVAFTGTGLTAGAGATPVVFATGSIAGALTARDGAVQDLRDRLDQLARQMVTAVNAAYNPGGTPGADFFDPAGLTAGTIALRAGLDANTLVAGAGGAGDNSIALAVAAVAAQRFSTAGGDVIDGTLSQFYSTTVSSLGQSLASANTRVEDQNRIEQLVRAQRDSVSGVNLDEEMAELLRYQRAFQASSRVFNVIDDLLDTVVNRLGTM
ncbi:MAG: flagellar hook-associated protein FlgK [Opitutaceae bacterium]|nr:flagellar hook-associated protein FlgK [Opitutaceae bacterium]